MEDPRKTETAPDQRDEITREVTRVMLREFVGTSAVKRRLKGFLLDGAMRRRMFER